MANKKLQSRNRSSANLATHLLNAIKQQAEKEDRSIECLHDKYTRLGMIQCRVPIDGELDNLKET
jgi:hypothetical protein